MTFNGQNYTERQETVNAFAYYFKSTYSDSISDHTDISEVHTVPILNIKEMSEPDLLRIFKAMKPTMTSGPDQIPGFLIKDCRFFLLTSLLRIFDSSFSSGIYPSCWNL